MTRQCVPKGNVPLFLVIFIAFSAVVAHGEDILRPAAYRERPAGRPGTDKVLPAAFLPVNAGHIIGRRFLILDRHNPLRHPQIFFAQDLLDAHKKTVIVKVFDPSRYYSFDEEDMRFFKKLFEQEIEIAQDLTRRRALCAAKYIARGENWFAFEEFEGESFMDILEYRRFSFDELLYLMQLFLVGLSEIHDAGVVHGDIGPGNIFKTTGMDIKILDFGNARYTDRPPVLPDNMLSGTIDFLSPENWKDGNITPQSDLYQTALLFYKILINDLPETAANAVKRGMTPPHLNITDSIVLSSVYRSALFHGNDMKAVADDLAAFINKGLNHDLSLRYQSADEMLGDLDKIAKKWREAILARTVARPAAVPNMVQEVVLAEAGV